MQVHVALCHCQNGYQNCLDWELQVQFLDCFWVKWWSVSRTRDIRAVCVEGICCFSKAYLTTFQLSSIAAFTSLWLWQGGVSKLHVIDCVVCLFESHSVLDWVWFKWDTFICYYTDRTLCDKVLYKRTGQYYRSRYFWLTLLVGQLDYFTDNFLTCLYAWILTTLIYEFSLL